MPTELTKRVSRRIGDRVVEIDVNGLAIRNVGCSVRSRFTLDELDALRPRYALTMQEAFAKPPPRGWMPEPDERVYLAGGRESGRVERVIEAMGGPLVFVCVGRLVRQYARAELRPAPPAGRRRKRKPDGPAPSNGG